MKDRLQQLAAEMQTAYDRWVQHDNTGEKQADEVLAKVVEAIASRSKHAAILREIIATYKRLPGHR